MTKLVIVESPGKINKIKSYLGSGYVVMASVGHIRDLAKNSISVDPNNNFEPTYEITPDKKNVVANLRKVAKTADEIIIASDGDREGEAIAYHLVDVLNIKDYKRIIFHEITKNAIIKAIGSPTKIDMNMFYSQQTRRILDRIVGYKLSPILKSIPNLSTHSLGAGRVQSVVTRLIVDKERDIEEFLSSDKSSTYNITGDFIINNINFRASYVHNKIVDDQIKIKSIENIVPSDDINLSSVKIIKSSVDSKDQIKLIVISIRADQQFNISSVTNTERFRHPPQPFITSSLQQESSYKLKFQLKKTMTLAQKLYEKGLITYMRTDSPALSNEALNYIKKQILDDPSIGESYYQYRQFKAKGQNAQEAHEAIRPTHFNVYDLTDYELNNTDEEKLYQLIWNRSVASQMKPAKYNDQHIRLSNTLGINFEGTNSILMFDGYLKLYNNDDEENSDQNIENQHIKINDQNLKLNKVNWTKILFKETFSSPPTRYNEPSLVKKLESLGIGRPSTYASIISKIQEHKYIRVGNTQGIEKPIITYTLRYISTDTKAKFEKKSSIQKISNEKLRLLPTSDGIIVTDYLINNFSQIMDYKFTAHMEKLLDDIAQGNKIWYEVLGEFYEVLKGQFTKLNMNIDSGFVSNIQNNSENKYQIIGKHPKYGDITYMEARYGPTFKINLGGRSNKDLYVNAGKLKPTDQNIVESAIKYIDYKLKKTINTTDTSNIINTNTAKISKTSKGKKSYKSGQKSKTNNLT